MHGLDVIELGCGTAYFGAWLVNDPDRVKAEQVVFYLAPD
jgi:hypothetical protein